VVSKNKSAHVKIVVKYLKYSGNAFTTKPTH